MEMKSTRRLNVGQSQAWETLCDPQVLQACIPGCDRFSEDTPGHYNVSGVMKVNGAVSRFEGQVQLTDVNAPESYRMLFECQSGVTGFGQGEAKVWLEPSGAQQCDMHYLLSGQLGGKLAEVDSQVIQRYSFEMVEGFFLRFDETLAKRYAQPDLAPQDLHQNYLYDAALAMAPEALPLVDQDALENERLKVPTWMWIVLVAGVLLFIVLMTRQA